MRKVLASGGRSANTPSSASSHSGSSSTKLMKSRSRLDIPGARKEGVPSNMVAKVHTFARVLFFILNIKYRVNSCTCRVGLPPFYRPSRSSQLWPRYKNRSWRKSGGKRRRSKRQKLGEKKS